MRYAIPIKNGRGVDSAIATSQSECQRVLVVDINDGTLTSHVERNDVRGDVSRMMRRIIDAKAGAAVFGEASTEQVQLLSDLGVTVYVCAQDTARHALCNVHGNCLQDASGTCLCPDE